MFERDYLMRLLSQLVDGVIRTIELRHREEDPKLAADSLEQIIAQATDIDGEILLGLSPDSISDILLVSGTDPAAVGFIARSLLLVADYLDEAGDSALANLRRDQGFSLARSFGLDIDRSVGAEDAVAAYAQDMRS